MPEHLSPHCSIHSNGYFAATEARLRDAGKKFRLLVTTFPTDCTREYVVK